MCSQQGTHMHMFACSQCAVHLGIIEDVPTHILRTCGGWVGGGVGHIELWGGSRGGCCVTTC